MNENMVRLFISVSLPGELKERIAAFQQQLRRLDGDIRWARPETMHLTLKFLGDVESGRVSSLKQALEKAATEISPFTVRLAGTGRFPMKGRPRVLWIGIDEGADELAGLARGIDDQLAALKFPGEEHPYSAHITLGRVRSERRIDTILAALEGGFPGGEFIVDSIHLMKSDLLPEGARHTALSSIQL